MDTPDCPICRCPTSAFAPDGSHLCDPAALAREVARLTAEIAALRRSQRLPTNPNLPAACKGCGGPMLLENLFVDDGCHCNTPRGVNFTPQPCAYCGILDCVRPGHRLRALFGYPAMALLEGAGPLPR